MNILIIGASRGIGRYLLDSLWADGHSVQGVSRHDVLGLANEKLTYYIKADATKDYRYIYQNTTTPDLLINCVGIGSMNHFLFESTERLKSILDTNFICITALIKLFAKDMRYCDNASIINFSSIAVQKALEGESSYVASKAALEAWTRVVAKELSPFKIRINCIAPGPVDTDLIKGVPEEKIRAIGHKTEMEDIYNLVHFLSSRKAKNITGQTITLGV